MYWKINVRENNDDQGHKSAGSGETEKRPQAERLRSQGCALPTLQLPGLMQESRCRHGPLQPRIRIFPKPLFGYFGRLN
ncbi:hypothetical protein BBD41_07480 [Paenibacillus ihbetae]|uniref:Uncharacterized protein n=1 Tax=Paenibacillus ihbetae TaxID=1870820 RepID=A0A1B2DXG8_9BACL|nr:hypothetical protein BBD41_07480 [Paenibacillus ihbetae]OOC58346.1 hypothetical protein BBD40_21715 [Paenibacillus ihbetae]